MASSAEEHEVVVATASDTGGERQAQGSAEPGENAADNRENDVIEPAPHNVEEDEDEFLPRGWDATSSAASTSLAPSIYAHEYSFGRRYHAYKHGKYPIPNDDFEQNREDMKHAMLLEATDGKLFYAPTGDNPQKIIDIGTGTGIWAIDVADHYPGAQVLGTDLSPIQPTWIPPNCKFIVDDLDDEWANGSDFDLVHLRSMALILPDTQKVIDVAYQNLKPGGWIEFQETYGMPQCDDGTMKDDDAIKRYYEMCVEAMAKFGMNIDKPLHLRPELEKAGFTNVQCVIKKLPMGTWPHDKTQRLIGYFTQVALLDSLPSVLAKPFAALGLSEQEREVWGAKVRQAVKATQIHRYYNYYFWYAQKPTS